KSGPRRAIAAAAVNTLSTDAVRAGVEPLRSKSTSPVSARTTYPSSDMSRPSDAGPATEQVRRRFAVTGWSDTGRGGFSVSVGLVTGAVSERDAHATPAKIEPVPSSTNTRAPAETIQATGCLRSSAAMPPTFGAGAPTGASALASAGESA